MALKEKLRELRERDLRADRGVRLQEWRDAIKSLLDSIEEYLATYVTEGLMQCVREDIHRSEEGIGVYDTQELRIAAADRTIVVSPVARGVIGADGRVDVYRSGRRENGYHLLWSKDAEGESSWRIQPMRGRQYAPMVTALSKEQFEALIENLLEP
jgi:hypothetical protein